MVGKDSLVTRESGETMLSDNPAQSPATNIGEGVSSLTQRRARKRMDRVDDVDIVDNLIGNEPPARLSKFARLTKSEDGMQGESQLYGRFY